MERRATAFIAGASGFTGRALAAQDPREHHIDLTLQVRPGSAQRTKLGPDARVVELDVKDPVALEAAVEGQDAVVQLIGTMRHRFAETGDYEAVDFDTTRALVDAARRKHVGHFVLLSSVGAGLGLGSYLAWKKKTEGLVTGSGLPYTILRPSVLAGDAAFDERPKLSNTQAFMNGLSDTPLGAPFATLRPMPIQLLARIILALIAGGPLGRVLVGRSLFLYARQQGLLSPATWR